MSNTNETITDIIAEMRIFKCRNLETGELEVCNAIANYLADRLEAAWKREKAAIEADALAVGGIVEASRATTEKSSAVGNAAHRCELSKNTSKNGVDFGQLGNGAKMRKALLFVKQYFDKIDPFNIKTYTFAQIEVDYIKAAISAALAAPPRNCDRFGTDNAEASLAYEEFCDRAEVEESVNGAIAWLLSLDADKKGGAK